jgi:hypothetical protein
MGGKNVFLWFCALVAAGGLIWLYNSRDTPKSPPLTQAEVKVRLAAAHQKIRALFPPGWYDLVNCSEFISFDGSRSLTLSRDYKARMQREQGRRLTRPPSDTSSTSGL